MSLWERHGAVRSGRGGDGRSSREGGFKRSCLFGSNIKLTDQLQGQSVEHSTHLLLRLPHLCVRILLLHSSEYVTCATLLSTFSYNQSAVFSWRKQMPLIRHFCLISCRIPLASGDPLSVLYGIFLTWIWDPVEGHVLHYTCHMILGM